METIDEIRARIGASVPDARLDILRNETPSGQHSLIVDAGHAREVAKFLRDDSQLRLDYCSNVTGIDWLDAELTEKVKVKKMVEGVEKEVEETRKTKRPGYLETVYHLYSMAKKHGPLVMRVCTVNRAEQVQLPSLTPIWRSCEFQEREVFDLYGIEFEGHPDLRRILMWDGFKDFPMRKDYTEPDDYEYEPTPHDDVLTRTREHYPSEAKQNAPGS